MNTYGTFTIANPLTSPPPVITVTTGQNWEYISIYNLSPYLLVLNFEGLGAITFPEWHREDIPVSYAQKRYQGVLFITPSLILTGQSNPPSSYIIINAYSPGELAQPTSASIPRLMNTVSAVGAGTGLVLVQHFTLNQNPTLTIPDQSAQGQLLLLDGFHFTGHADPTGSSGIDVAITVNALVTGGDYHYWVMQGENPMVVDDVNYTPRGIAQAPATAITLVVSFSGTLGAGKCTIAARYHYETMF